jgi:hypothetical protein
MPTNISSLSVGELKKKLKAAGLSTSGLKKDLLSRLQAHEREHGREFSPSPEGSDLKAPSPSTHDSHESGQNITEDLTKSTTQDDEATLSVKDVGKSKASHHPPTPAIYIGNLSRPLAVPSFKAHISNLSGVAPEFIYLSGLRTHCFVIFSSVEISRKVREALNGAKYPANDDTRDPLYVDYLPVDVARSWVEEEEARNNPMERWVVEYSQQDGSDVLLSHRLVERKHHAAEAQSKRQQIRSAVDAQKPSIGNRRAQNSDSDEPPLKRSRVRSPLPSLLSRWPYIRHTRFQPSIMFSEAPPR